MIVVTADPGKKGAIAWGSVDPGLDEPKLFDVGVIDMPLAKSFLSDGTEVSEVCGASVFREMSRIRPGLAVFEKLTPRPHSGRGKGGGVVQEWSLGKGYGAICTAAQCWFSCAGMPPGLHLVRPDVWKASMGLNSDKEVSLNAAREVFPELAGSLRRKKDEGRAEALMILEYYRTRLYSMTDGIPVI